VLHGRDNERAQLGALLDAARAGQAGATVVRGEPGVGKSALLQDISASASDMRVLRTQGLESELPLAFAGLHKLLQPVLPLVDRLAPPQARALRVVLGEEEGASVEPFLVGLATQALLVEAAESCAVLCLVDDAQWLDRASVEALLFAARRLQADPVALVFAVREDGSSSFVAEGLPTLALKGLDPSSARALLAERIGGPLPDNVSEALLEQSAGNPLALVELPTGLTPSQLEGAAPMPAQLPVTDVVQRVFLDRCRRLSPQVQTLLLVAAADDSGSLLTVRRAAERLGVEALAFEEAENARLLFTDRDHITVRHPLVRSAMYQAATGHERREAHRALAQALGASEEPDRQAWHRAAAVDGPDEEVAAALVLAAERAERRGGYAAAADGYERAAELTTGEQLRAARQYAAARNAWASGQATRARARAEEALAVAEDRLLRADLERLRARIEINVGSATNAYRIFARAARAVAVDDPARGLEMSVAATLTYLFDATTHSSLDPEPLPEQLLALEPDDTPRTRCLRHLLAATTADTDGRWEPALASLISAVEVSAEVDDTDVLGNLGNTALHLGHDAAHRQCYTRMLAVARDRGAGMTVLYALPRYAFADLLGGQWSGVRESADEGLSLSANVGQRALGAAPLAWLTLLSALQGADDYDSCRVRLDAAMQDRLGVLTDPVHDLSRWAAGVRAAHEGDAAGALHQLSRLRLPALSRMAALDRFEAAVRSDERALAQQWLDELVAFADTVKWPWALGAADHGRALLAGAEDAPDLFESALSHYAESDRPYDRARTHLAYGELLRRSQRRVDARPHLREALALFEDLNAAPLAARAAQELRASGETARKRDPSTLAALTPMELQVAQLVGQGMSNKEVAAKLWISPRTVAFHLRGLFAKLQISSRGELAQLQLADRAS
jgi:DNA-binding CsgD family transcriptional regulator